MRESEDVMQGQIMEGRERVWLRGLKKWRRGFLGEGRGVVEGVEGAVMCGATFEMLLFVIPCCLFFCCLPLLRSSVV